MLVGERDTCDRGAVILVVAVGVHFVCGQGRDRVRPVVNLFLDELEEVDQYSWASGTLAWLYRYLGQASRAGAGGGWLSHTSAVLDLRVIFEFQAISL
ncbi:unnamed protein product [Linum tenue]|uniref:Aminotransferase-like plant mobile domain-containing protein n=1 Tax=Linum tenue TaxID=586396 RepID=A0AAV0S2B6_9ROSI|nr:unnamed protein product [Linum tenue]CAI0625882.1 unnamed protein product [Linum tenue]CAI0625906.1 unnamed protein product [Linum tenue]